MSAQPIEASALGNLTNADADFAVVWESPEESLLFWTQDRMHFPGPMSPLTYSIYGVALPRGMVKAMHTYDLPMEEVRCKRINAHRYWAFIPERVPPEQLEARGKRVQDKILAAVFGLRQLWNDRWLPEVQRHLAFWDSFDLRGSSLGKLVDHFEETVQRIERLTEIHFEVAIPFMVAQSEFEELFKGLFPGATSFDAYRLLEGFDNKTLELGRAIHKLAREAAAVPHVQRIFERTDAKDVIPELRKAPEGRAFLSRLEAFLDAYGRRGESLDPARPWWIEDPTPVLKNLKDYIRQSDLDPEADLARVATERERLVADARHKLGRYPRPVAEQFELLLSAAQFANALSEEHTFSIDYDGFLRLRPVALEIGRRFVEAGVLEKPEGIFCLDPDEIVETARALPRLDRRPLVAERRREMERFSGISPPDALGTPPSGPSPDDPFSRSVDKLFGRPPAPAAEPNVFRGTGGSPGKVRGPARVVRSLAEAGRVRKGEVLVAETTGPSWTPLFATVSAVVTDTGGILSHCAIVAREYGIPAVVGTGEATRAIRDGQLLEVDGDAGEVRVLPA